jgi:hypothetical protein
MIGCTKLSSSDKALSPLSAQCQLVTAASKVSAVIIRSSCPTPVRSNGGLHFDDAELPRLCGGKSWVPLLILFLDLLAFSSSPPDALPKSPSLSLPPHNTINSDHGRTHQPSRLTHSPPSTSRLPPHSVCLSSPTASSSSSPLSDPPPAHPNPHLSVRFPLRLLAAPALLGRHQSGASAEHRRRGNFRAAPSLWRNRAPHRDPGDLQAHR